MFTLQAANLGKQYGDRRVFSSIDFELNTGESLAVTGVNGSGKTTLLKLLVDLIRPTVGHVTYLNDGQVLQDNQLLNRISFVAPYLNLYDQLTAEENLQFFAAVRGGNITGKEIESLLARVGLGRRGLDLVRSYSSGMQQRLKYAVALLNKPDYLFIDEPTAALDEAGKELVLSILDDRRPDSIIVIATNEKEEYALAQRQCRLDQ